MHSILRFPTVVRDVVAAALFVAAAPFVVASAAHAQTSATPAPEVETPEAAILVSFASEPAPDAGSSATVRGGTVVTNLVERDRRGEFVLERRFDRDSVVRGMTIADGIAIALPARTGAAATSGGAPAPTLVVAGHLDELDLPLAHPDSTVLWIDVTSTDGSHPIATIAVTAGQLGRKSVVERWERIQEVRVDVGDLLSRGDAADDVRLRIRYAGNASVALRDISLESSTLHSGE